MVWPSCHPWCLISGPGFIRSPIFYLSINEAPVFSHIETGPKQPLAHRKLDKPSVAAQREGIARPGNRRPIHGIWKKYRFSRLSPVQAFKQTVPVHEYRRPEALYRGWCGRGQCAPELADLLVLPKAAAPPAIKANSFLVSQESPRKPYKAKQRRNDQLLLKFFLPATCSRARGLVVGGSPRSTRNETVQYGDLSAVLMQNAPFWGQWLRTWNSASRCSTTGSPRSKTGPGHRQWKCHIHFRRPHLDAAFIEAGILEITQKKNIQEVWPNLNFLYIMGGVVYPIPWAVRPGHPAKPINYLRSIMPAKAFAAQDRPDDEGWPFTTEHGVFFEFMPVDQYGKNSRKPWGWIQVQLNKQYALIISTTGVCGGILLAIRSSSLPKPTGSSSPGGWLIISMPSERRSSLIIRIRLSSKLTPRTGAVVNDYTAALYILPGKTTGGPMNGWSNLTRRRPTWTGLRQNLTPYSIAQ